MNHWEKIASLPVQVSVRSSGNSITNKTIQFDIFKDSTAFKAVPALDLDERRIANLPPELLFSYEKGKLSSERGAKDGNYYVLERIVQQLLAEQKISE